jgi:DNA-binding SARP family transcriptional activator
LIDFEEAHLSICAFGPLGIQTKTKVLGSDDLVGRKPRLLLERLLVGRNSVVHKSVIADALWPRNAPKNASGTIESYVSLLRKCLFSDRNLARQVIVTSSDGYRLNTDAIDLDLDRFDELTRRADTLGSGPKSLALRIQADSLRRGAVLEDALDEPWIQDLRYIYHERASLNLVMIAKAQLSTRNFTNAIRSAEAATGLEPYSEEAFRVIMLGQYALGHHTSARKTFEHVRDLVWTDLATDLTQVTEDLAAAIDAGESPSELIARLSLSMGSVETMVASTAHDAAAGPDLREASRRLPFLGRKAELSSLRNFVTNSSNPGLQIVLVGGAQGMGKTELLNRFEALLPQQLGRTNYAELAGSGRHYFAEGFLRSLSQTGAHDMTLLGSIDAARAEDVVLPPVAESLRRSGPTTILLDDLDMADDSDLIAIRWLKVNAPEVPLSIVATVGSGSWDSGRGDRRILADLELALGPLTETEVAPCGAALKRVLRLCKGNPRFMADLWRWRAAGLSGPPESLLAYVERRVQTLNEPLVDALYILTELCSPAELQELTDKLQGSLQRINRSLSIVASEGALLPIPNEDERGAA